MAPPLTLEQVLGYAAFLRWPQVLYRTAFTHERYHITAGEDGWNRWANDRPPETDLPAVLDVLRALDAAEPELAPVRKVLEQLRDVLLELRSAGSVTVAPAPAVPVFCFRCDTLLARRADRYVWHGLMLCEACHTRAQQATA